MRKRTLSLLLLALLTTASSADSQKEIPLIGLDDEDKPVLVTKNFDEYQGELQTLIEATSDSALPAFERIPAAERWHIHTIAVGIGSSIEAGLKAVIKLRVAPRFRLVFTNAKEAVIP